MIKIKWPQFFSKKQKTTINNLGEAVPIPVIKVNPDVAFYKSVQPKLDEIKSKFKKIDYSSIDYDETLEDYNLSDLSPEAVKLIIEIIKEDTRFRHEVRINAEVNLSKTNKLTIEDSTITSNPQNKNE